MNFKKYKKVFGIGFIIFSALIMLAILFKNDDLFNLFEIIKNINSKYIIIALVFIFIFWLLEAAMIYSLIAKLTDHKENLNTFWLAVKVTMIGQYYSNITPLASGGQPVQLYVLKDGDVSLSNGTAILICKFLLFQIGVTIYSLLLAVYKIKLLTNINNGASVFIIAGLTINMVMLSLIVLIAFNQQILLKLCAFFLNILYKMHIVKDVNNLASTIRKAFKIASSGRPGPVLVDVTKDVTANKCEYTKVVPVMEKTIKKYTKEDIAKAVELIKKAKKPFIYLGGGAIISGAEKEVAEFAKKIDSPVCDTLMGKGAFNGRDDLYTGMIGMHGTKTSNFGVSQCDLLIALGARFSDRVTGNAKKFASNAEILQIDIDAAEINKNIKTTASVVGDMKEVLSDLLAELEQQNHTEWTSYIRKMKQLYPLKYSKDKLTCPYIIEEIDRVTKGEAIISTDVGQHQMWAAQYYRYTKPRTFLSSGGLGTMGYGLGACIGAKVANPDKICINIAGDGCFRMNMNELATASRYNIPIIQVVINNHVLGMVRQWQTLFYDHRYSNTVLEDKVDFVKVAEALGCEAVRITKKEEVGPAIEKAIALQKPILLDCIIEEDDKVFPMVSPGAPISEAFDEEDLQKQN